MASKKIEQLKTLAESGDFLAKMYLGIAYYNGNEIYQSSEKAFKLFTQACNGGIAEAGYWLGVCHYYGHGTPMDHEAAKASFKKAAEIGIEKAETALKTYTFENEELISRAENGDAEAQYQLGKFYCECYYRGFGLPVYSKAAYWYLKAAKQNHPAALRYLPGIAVWAKEYEKPSQGMHERAIKIYERLAREGDAAAQYELGDWYYPAEGFKEGSAEKSFYWFKKSAENGYVPALRKLAKCYCNGVGCEEDLERAKSLFEEAGERGDAEIKYLVGNSYYSFNKIADKKREAYWYKRAAEAGHTYSQYTTAENYFRGKHDDQQQDWRVFERDYNKAFYWYNKAAESGDYEARFKVAKCYRYGYGTEPDLKKAVEIFSELAKCTHGNRKYACAQAAKEVADCYFNGGNGLKKNIRLAINWYESAHLRDVMSASVKLGDIYMRGWGVKRNYTFAASYYENALFNYQDYCYGGCENYDMDANARFGDCLYYGIGVKKDSEYAFSVYQDAGEYMSHTQCQYRMGRCYYHGIGVKKDLGKARDWWRSAAYDGDESAIGALKKYFNEDTETND